MTTLLTEKKPYPKLTMAFDTSPSVRMPKLNRLLEYNIAKIEVAAPKKPWKT